MGLFLDRQTDRQRDRHRDKDRHTSSWQGLGGGGTEGGEVIQQEQNVDQQFNNHYPLFVLPPNIYMYIYSFTVKLLIS